MLVNLSHPTNGELDSVLKYLTTLNSKDVFDDDLSIIHIKFD